MKKNILSKSIMAAMLGIAASTIKTPFGVRINKRKTPLIKNKSLPKSTHKRNKKKGY